MLFSLPDELVYMIYHICILPNNCNSMKLRTSCKDLYNNKVIMELQNIRNKCDYCKYIFRTWDNLPGISRNPLIISDYQTNMTLCITHSYKCHKCLRVGCYQDYNIIEDLCYQCLM